MNTDKRKDMSAMLDKYNASKEEHEKVHMWTLGLIASGIIDRPTSKGLNGPVLSKNIGGLNEFLK